MARILDLRAQPGALRRGDIVGFNSIPDDVTRPLRHALGPEFKEADPAGMRQAASTKGVTSQRFIGMVFDIYRETAGRRSDEPGIVGIIAFLMVPFTKRIQNDERNLMITNKPQIRDMGLSEKYNYRLCYFPVPIPVSADALGVEQEGRIVRFGSMDARLVATIEDHADRLERQHKLMTGLALDNQLYRILSGPRFRYDWLTTGGPRPREEEMPARPPEPKASRSLKTTQKATSAFNTASATTISLDDAANVGLISSDSWVAMKEIEDSGYFGTIGTLHDAYRVVTDREKDIPGLVTAFLPEVAIKTKDGNYESVQDLGRISLDQARDYGWIDDWVFQTLSTGTLRKGGHAPLKSLSEALSKMEDMQRESGEPPGLFFENYAFVGPKTRVMITDELDAARRTVEELRAGQEAESNAAFQAVRDDVTKAFRIFRAAVRKDGTLRKDQEARFEGVALVRRSEPEP